MLKKRIDQLLYASCGVVSALALFSIMWLTLVDVVGRKFFNHSIPGGLEVTEIMLVCVIFCALPLVSWRGEHVVFDTFDGFIPKPLQRVQVRLVHVFSAFVFVGLAYLMTIKAMRFCQLWRHHGLLAAAFATRCLGHECHDVRDGHRAPVAGRVG
jgi:TRAP-type C4-dicarboxylate transport system permease small subunit